MIKVKKKTVFTLYLFLVVSTKLMSQYYYIPDNNLRKELHRMGFTNKDTLLDVAKTNGLLQLDLSKKEIENLDGLQHFKQVWNLNIRANKIKELKNLPPNLTNLNCSGNKIKELKNLPPKLTNLNCSENEIKEFKDLPATLAYLECSNNKIETISNLPTNLRSLSCMNNQIKTVTNLPDNLKSLNISNNLITKFPELPASLESINYYNNRIDINKLPKLYKNAIPCDHPDQNCLPYELVNWKLLKNNIKDTTFELLELKVTIKTAHSWGFGDETRKLHFIKANERLICENENRYATPGEANLSEGIINEDIKNEHSISIEEFTTFLKNLYNRKMNLEFQIDDNIQTIDLKTKRNGDPPCWQNCIDCSVSGYRYEIYTTKDTIILKYNTQTFYDGHICSESWSRDHTDITAPQRIEAILNMLYAYKLEEIVLKKKIDKYDYLRNVLGWGRSYK